MAGVKVDWRVSEEKIAEAVRRVAEFAHPSRIIVFGSAARGETHEHSDLDLLVVMAEEVPDWRRESVRMGEVLRGIPMAVDILVISEAEAAAAVGNRYGVLGEALRRGKVVYEAPR